MPYPALYNRFNISGDPVDNESFPDTDTPPIVRYPEAQAIDGNGVPCKFVGAPWAEVGRAWISDTGRAYYYGKLVGGSATLVMVELYNPREGQWRRYYAQMSIPELDSARPGDDYALTGFRVRFDNLQ